MLAALTPVLLFAAFILLLLISLSVPIIKSIYLFKLSAHVSAGVIDSAVSGDVKFGVWGYCISPVEVTCVICILSRFRVSTLTRFRRILGIHKDSGGECSKATLGYTFDKAVGNAL
jgi:hypothetical protein